MKELVSIILPVYNVEDYISVCLNSIISQTYKNLEIIVVDDGSKDSSGKISDEFARIDPRIKVIHKENGGVSSARNVGLREALGDFVIFVDPDDWITEDHVEYLLNLQKISDADMCISTSLFTHKNEKQFSQICEKTISNKEAATILLSPDIYVGSYSKIYRRKWLNANNIWQNESIYSGEGLHFTVKAAQYANYVTISNRKIYYYRRNVSKSATTKFNISMFTNNEYSLDVIRKEKIIDYPQFNEMIDNFHVQLMISGIIALINNRAILKYNDIYNRWTKEVNKKSLKILLSKVVGVRAKIRIIIAIFFPRVMAFLSRKKREFIFKKSV